MEKGISLSILKRKRIQKNILKRKQRNRKRKRAEEKQYDNMKSNQTR